MILQFFYAAESIDPYSDSAQHTREKMFSPLKATENVLKNVCLGKSVVTVVAYLI
jgi:hypothetical protein